jgi:hypothetical protein
LGRGSLFTVILPVTTQEENAAPQEAVPRTAVAAARDGDSRADPNIDFTDS